MVKKNTGKSRNLKIGRAAVFGLLLLISSVGYGQDGIDVEVDEGTNSATSFLTECVATYQYLADIASAGTGNSAQANQFEQLAEQYRYLATVFAAILFPDEDAEFANSIVEARVGLKFTEWVAAARQNGADSVVATIAPIARNCGAFNDPNVERMRGSQEFSVAMAKIDASEFGL